MGCDPAREGVSIHAPAWRATKKPVEILSPCDRFNPRPRMEGDITHSLPPYVCVGFNPRPRMEGDKGIKVKFSLGLFQSTPPHGGRLMSKK